MAGCSHGGACLGSKIEEMKNGDLHEAFLDPSELEQAVVSLHSPRH